MKVVNLEDIRHGIRVAKIGRDIAKILGMPHADINNLYLASLFHDIGKAHIDQHTLNKNERLSQTERNHINEHPKHSYDEIISLGYSKEIAVTILYHHENYDGTGYPDGLKGDDIPIGARILKITDVFDALTMDRPYRKRLNIHDAIAILEKEKSTFDPIIFDLFIKYLNYKYENHADRLGKADFEVMHTDLEDSDIRKLKEASVIRLYNPSRKKINSNLTKLELIQE